MSQSRSGGSGPLRRAPREASNLPHRPTGSRSRAGSFRAWTFAPAQAAAGPDEFRTAPLWGMRTHDRLMHDGETFTRNNSILRHSNEAVNVINNYRNLSTTQKNQLITFLNSL